jgi:hypothetical protein
MPARASVSGSSKFAPLKPEEANGLGVASNDLERRRAIGQFFTPPAVAEFVWDMLEIIHGGRFERQARVVDPACGEGVFLRVAAERGQVAAGCLFGADIDERLEPLWRQNPLLKQMRLFLANGLLDLPEQGLQAGTFDVVAGNPPFAGTGLRDLLRLLDEPSAAAMPETDLFGALVMQEGPLPAAPPLTPSQRLQLDHLAKALGRYTCWRLSKESSQNGEGEADPDDLFGGTGRRAARKNSAAELEKAVQLAAAWPWNRALDPRRLETRLLLRRLASTAIEVFFMERFLRLAKPGGLIAVIVPESIVASDQLAPLRRWLLTELDLLAVVSLPQKVFTGVGANAKTSVVFARRRLAPERIERPGPDLPQENDWDDSEEGGPGRKVIMAAPCPEAPGYSLERFFADVLQASKERPNSFEPETT